MGFLSKIKDTVFKPITKIIQKPIDIVKTTVDKTKGVGQDVIDSTVKPARDIVKGVAAGGVATIEGSTSLIKGAGEGLSGLAKNPDFLAAAGTTFLDPTGGLATSFLNRKNNITSDPVLATTAREFGSSPEINLSTTPNIQSGGSNIMLPLILVGGAIGAFILFRSKK